MIARVTLSIRSTLVASLLVLACKSSGDTANPEGEDPVGASGQDATAGGDTAVASDVPPAVAQLDPMPGAKQLGSKMWRRFGKGEWTGHSFFVPDAKARAVTVLVDMEGGGEAVSDEFELVLEPEGLTLVEGEPRIDGRVPPGLKRRAQWKFTAAQPGIAKIRFVTVKEGEEKGGTTACLNFADDGIYRCTEKEAGDTTAPAAKRATFCCVKGKGDAGESCEPMIDRVDMMKGCMKAKKFTLACDAGALCDAKGCKCNK
jgi:hypothetical protein